MLLLTDSADTRRSSPLNRALRFRLCIQQMVHVPEAMRLPCHSQINTAISIRRQFYPNPHGEQGAQVGRTVLKLR